MLSDGVPMLSDGVPMLSDGAPMLSVGAPMLSDGAPMLSGCAPMLSGCAPMLSGCAPMLSDCAPMSSVSASMLSGCASVFCERGGSSHALRKRPPAVESNGFKKVLDYSHQHLILNDKGEKLMPKHTIRGGQFHGSVICNSLGNY